MENYSASQTKYLEPVYNFNQNALFLIHCLPEGSYTTIPEMIRLYCTFVALLCIAATSTETSIPAPNLPVPTDQTVAVHETEMPTANLVKFNPATETLEMEPTTTPPPEEDEDTEAVVSNDGEDDGEDGGSTKNTVNLFCFVATIGLILLTKSRV